MKLSVFELLFLLVFRIVMVHDFWRPVKSQDVFVTNTVTERAVRRWERGGE